MWFFFLVELQLLDANLSKWYMQSTPYAFSSQLLVATYLKIQWLYFNSYGLNTTLVIYAKDQQILILWKIKVQQATW